jgi:hypothetical protein
MSARKDIRTTKLVLLQCPQRGVTLKDGFHPVTLGGCNRKGVIPFESGVRCRRLSCEHLVEVLGRVLGAEGPSMGFVHAKEEARVAGNAVRGDGYAGRAGFSFLVCDAAANHFRMVRSYTPMRVATEIAAPSRARSTVTCLLSIVYVFILQT